jgi:Fe-S cluster assembly iron-binding protein IscA
MITVTDKAKDELRQTLDQAGVNEEGVGIRLAPTQAGDAPGETRLGLILDHARAGDQVVEHEGRIVLMVDADIAAQLDGTTLDVVDTPEGRTLALSRP